MNASMATLHEVTKSEHGFPTASSLAQRVASRESERYTLHSDNLNEMWVRVLKTIGYDVGFTRGLGPYLWDRKEIGRAHV